MTPSAQAITYPGNNPISQIVNQLRIDLDRNGYVFGGLFIAERHDRGFNFGLLFAEAMPRDFKLQLFADMQIALDDARKLL
jgi:hypothetical protein